MMFKRLGFTITAITSLMLLGIFVARVQAQEVKLPMLTTPGAFGVRLVALGFVDQHRPDLKIEAYIWYPADKTKGQQKVGSSLILKDAPPDRSGAPYPLVIYSHGWLGNPGELPKVMEQLASQGYIVVGAHHHDTSPIRFELVDRPLDIMLLLDSLAGITKGDLAGMIDTNKIGLMGYSQGAETVLQMLGLLRDPIHFTSWCAANPNLKSWDCIPPASIASVSTVNVGQWNFDEIAKYRAQLGLETTDQGQWAPFGDKRIQAVMAMAPGDFPLTTEEMLNSVTTPTMILHGTADTTCDYEGNAYVHMQTLGAKIVIL